MVKRTEHRRKKNVIRGGATPMLSIKQISDRYGFHPNTVRAWVTRDKLRHKRQGPGKKIFIRQDDVEAFIKEWYEEDEEWFCMELLRLEDFFAKFYKPSLFKEGNKVNKEKMRLSKKDFTPEPTSGNEDGDG